LFTISFGNLFGQEILTDSVPVNEEISESFFYKPVIGVGVGTLNYIGDVTDNFRTVISGTIAPKITLSTYLDKARHVNLEFFYLSGVVSGNQSKPGSTLNFKSDITDFGVGIRLTLRDFQMRRWALSPYVGLGIESIRFDSKGDLLDAKEKPYNYTANGTIIDSVGILTSRDFTYETDLREADLYGYGKYSETSFGIPLDLGMDLALSDRISLRFGTSFHFLFSDYIDNRTSEDKGLFGNTGNDLITNAYVSMHIDLFNMPIIMNIRKFFVEEEFDVIMIEDEDGDMVQDFFDQCPFTPFGADVDSDGCPLDDDQDGVPNFSDKELDTSFGAHINVDGVELSEDELIALLSLKEAVPRDQVINYLNREIRFSKYGHGKGTNIPSKLQEIDLNQNNDISYEELLNAIDAFFDYRTSLSKEDMYELIEFFFKQ
jgi:hypothetical protein